MAHRPRAQHVRGGGGHLARVGVGALPRQPVRPEPGRHAPAPLGLGRAGVTQRLEVEVGAELLVGPAGDDRVEPAARVEVHDEPLTRPDVRRQVEAVLGLPGVEVDLRHGRAPELVRGVVGDPGGEHLQRGQIGPRLDRDGRAHHLVGRGQLAAPGPAPPLLAQLAGADQQRGDGGQLRRAPGELGAEGQVERAPGAVVAEHGAHVADQHLGRRAVLAQQVVYDSPGLGPCVFSMCLPHTATLRREILFRESPRRHHPQASRRHPRPSSQPTAAPASATPAPMPKEASITHGRVSACRAAGRS